MLTDPTFMWEVPREMSGRVSLGANLLGVLVLAAGCGGGGDGAPRVTLTDNSCTYSGAPTHAPGAFNVEAENQTSHFAHFAVLELAPGFSIEDARQFWERLRAAHFRGKKLQPPTEDEVFDLGSGAATEVEPQATSLLPVNASSGRFVIVCWEYPSADTRESSQDAPVPATIYVPAEVDIR
jgi:hypothetical protein